MFFFSNALYCCVTKVKAFVMFFCVLSPLSVLCDRVREGERERGGEEGNGNVNNAVEKNGYEYLYRHFIRKQNEFFFFFFKD